MRYLSLDKTEFTALLKFKKVSFLLYFIYFILIYLILYFYLLKYISINYGIMIVIVFVPLASIIALVFFLTHKDYLRDIIKKEKKVYRGVLSSKSTRKRGGSTYYVFKMDGNCFVVDKDTYEKCAIGDIIEFHTSVFTKYLFKVETFGHAE